MTSESLGGCPRIRFHVISTEGRNLKLTYFQYNKISRYARNDNFGELSDSLLVEVCVKFSHSGTLLSGLDGPQNPPLLG